MPSSSNQAILWGATGHARVLRECLSHQGVAIIAVFDNNPSVQAPFGDVPLHHGSSGFRDWLRETPDPAAIGFLVAIGGHNGRDRLALHEMLEGEGLRPLVARHPSAFVAASAVLLSGAQVLAQSAVCVDARLGRGVIINTAASVDHECVIEDGAHVCPGAHLAGCVTVERFAMIGTGAIVLPRLHIGEGAIVGGGAVVVRDVAAGSVVVGNPARPIRVPA